MNGLCHNCLRSNIEVFPVLGKTVCKDCMKETDNSKSSSSHK